MNRKVVLGVFFGGLILLFVLLFFHFLINPTEVSKPTETVPVIDAVIVATPSATLVPTVKPTVKPTVVPTTKPTDKPMPTLIPAIVIPKGATALCKDGTYSFSQTRSGTCSHHGGVFKWL